MAEQQIEQQILDQNTPIEDLHAELAHLTTLQDNIECSTLALTRFSHWLEALDVLSFNAFLTLNTALRHSTMLSDDPVSIIFSQLLADIWAMPEGQLDGELLMQTLEEANMEAVAMAEESEGLGERRGEIERELWEREHYAGLDGEQIDPLDGLEDLNLQEEDEEMMELYRINGRNPY